jgi:hypothetical protein
VADLTVEGESATIRGGEMVPGRKIREKISIDVGKVSGRLKEEMFSKTNKKL